MDQDATWHRGIGLGPGDIVLDGDPAAPHQKGADPPIFCPRLLWPNGCVDQYATCTEVGLGLRDIVLYGDQAPPPLKGSSPHPQLLANVRCGQTAAWTKMPLGMEIDLGPGDFLFDGDAATPRNRAHPAPPKF